MKKRIDIYLFERGHFQSREQARRAVMAGEVYVNGKRIEKPGQMVGETAEIFLDRNERQYVSRGAYKLEKALQTFGIDVRGKICLDAGASTGGFTDVMLQSGAGLVYAVDVGYGQLAWKLRRDPRVIVFERQNIRYFDPRALGEKPSFIAADLSFISLRLIFAKFKELILPDGEMVTLIKPQFEAGKENVGKKGVVRDRRIHLEVIRKLKEDAPQNGWYLANLDYSPLLGPEGNIEFLGHWRQEAGPDLDVGQVVDAAWQELTS